MNLVALTLFGCGPDLPAGWEDATPVVSLRQSECDGNPYETFDERVESELGTPLTVDVYETHFRCAQDVEAYWRPVGAGVEVLVQPIDMSPKDVAACDCLYDLNIEVSEPEEPVTTLEVFRRWDSLGDANEPVSIGTISIAVD